MPQFLQPNKIIEQLDIKPGMYIGDFGSARGDFAIQSAKIVGNEGRVVAVDVLKEPLTALQSRAEAEGLSNIEIVRANLEVDNSDKIASESLDYVFLVNVLFQSKLHKEVINEIKRTLKPGGRMVVIDWKVFNAAFGPQPGQEIDPEAIKVIAETEGFKFEKNLDVGQYHWGRVYAKK